MARQSFDLAQLADRLLEKENRHDLADPASR
jgi:hypothetical protein